MHNVGLKIALKNAYYNLNTIRKIIKQRTFLYNSNTKPEKLGEKIVILGNSPEADSYFLNRNDFSDYDLLTVNFFPLDGERFVQYRPKYHCLLDPGFFNSSLVPYQKVRVIKLWEILDEVDWNLNLIVDGSVEIPIKNKHIHIIRMAKVSYYNSSTRFQKWCLYRNLCISMAHNVATIGILFAIIFGYRDIALFGMNMDWMKDMSVNKNNQLICTDRHYYGVQKGIVKEDTYLGQLNATVKTFWGFEECSRLAAFKGIKIINYNPESYLQCFEKSGLISKNTLTVKE